ncbi:MAG: TetR/AcrR family transcriptional regulator [Pseudonocardia sp.]
MNVAETCFERYGIRRTTMEDIAADAKVSRPTLCSPDGCRSCSAPPPLGSRSCSDRGAARSNGCRPHALSLRQASFERSASGTRRVIRCSPAWSPHR